MGFLYGTYADDGKVRVEAIYEPPQTSDATSFELLDDPSKDRVEALAGLMHVGRWGRTRVAGGMHQLTTLDSPVGSFKESGGYLLILPGRMDSCSRDVKFSQQLSCS